MKKIISLLIISAFLGCTHQISRIKYDTCDIPIKKFETIDSTAASRIGAMKLTDSGFSKICSEEDAIKILLKEACNIHADFINIVKETYPDKQSNCYRCKAEFYRYKK